MPDILSVRLQNILRRSEPALRKAVIATDNMNKTERDCSKQSFFQCEQRDKKE